MARTARKQKKTRLNLEMPQEVYDRIEGLRDRTKADSMSEVVRRALALYDLMTEEAIEGWEVKLTRDDEEREIVIL